MTHSYNALTDEQLSVIGTQYNPDKGSSSWYRIGSALLTGMLVVSIWFWKIAPDEKSPTKLMVEPATELLSSFVQPAPDLSWLSNDLGFKVAVPDLKRIGVEVTTVGEANFGGHPAAVMQFQKGYSVFLLYSFNQNTKLLQEMRMVDSGDHKFYVTSGGEVSVVVWSDRSAGYHALAAKLTEQDILALAANVAGLT